ncbi:uncharacterized protein LACBIDRAFT_293504 [Laccaria bicolor S238N-H82]|uniref:Predicted protein n=1 Tax=Laccaria bicolor (strain S238N-H82 / ATCC MYA-4686) TaxID=486041 RepID=B0D3Y5_LACBS|nr:uncharacterized protein LACBIDRAFT_293504 [Laccaria bicolor S238N-H82]EDR11011.1 predicted protein [Laccaria bicolor S238N-H82]|eukprot:XP_001878312.1 predicted protein [Laccaria bicolor S238N-H82]
MAASTDNNLKVFHRYAKMLARDDVEIYTSHADKLARWLCDEKAYYPAARKEISQRTLRKAVTGSEDLSLPFNVSAYLSHPLVAPYVRLVGAMKPFRNQFVEPSHQVHIMQLLNSIALGPLSSSYSPGVASGVVTQQPPSHLVQQPPAPTDIPVKVTEPVADTSSRPPTKIKAKKKKLIDIDSLVAHDIKALRQRQDNPRPINGLPQLSTASQIDQRAVDPNLPAAVVSAPSTLSNLSDTSFRGHSREGDSTSKEDFQNGTGLKSKFVLAESDRDVKSLDVTAAVDGHVSKDYTNEDQDQSLQVDSSPAGDPMSVDGSSEMTAMSFVNPTNDNEVRDEHLQAEARPALDSLPPASEPEVGQRRTESIDRVLPINYSDKDEEMQDINQGTFHVASGQIDLTRTPPIDISDPTQLPHPSRPALDSLPPASEPEVGQRRTESIDHVLPINYSDKDEEMQDIDHQGTLHATSGQIDLTRTPPIDISDPTQLPHPSSARHIPVEQSTASLNLIGDVNVVADVTLLQSRPKNAPPIDSPESASDVQAGVFGDEMRVVARQKGLSSKSRISVEFEIPEGQYAILMQWVNRKHASFGLQNSLCLSLGCYSAVELSQAAGAAVSSFEEQIYSLRSSWPTHGSLSMHVSVNDDKIDLPLSPPFLTTPDGLVDVSQFLSVGRNILELHQRQDLSDFIFVLHAHHPTPRQLEQIAQIQKKDNEWRNWLQQVCVAIDVPVVPA